MEYWLIATNIFFSLSLFVATRSTKKLHNGVNVFLKCGTKKIVQSCTFSAVNASTVYSQLLIKNFSQRTTLFLLAFAAKNQHELQYTQSCSLAAVQELET